MFRTIKDFEERWANHMEHTNTIFVAMTDASLSQQVAEGHWTLGRIAWHIVTSIPEMMALTGLSFTSLAKDAPMPVSAADIRTAYNDVAGELFTKVKHDWTDGDLIKQDDMYREKWDRGFTLYVLMAHEIHHRAQMTVLMRQAGVVVPGIFGPAKEEWEKYEMKPPEI